MGKRDIKIVFWGTPEFALPSLEALTRNDYKIVALITNPDEPVGRKQILTPPPTKVWAEKHKIPVFQPEKLIISHPSFVIPDADLYVVAAYGKIIPKEIIEIPKYGSLNIHPSLLPRWRGPSPIQHTILHGDKETGVTVIKIDELMDHGPAIAASSFQLPSSSKPTYKELHNQLAKLGAELLIEILPKWLAEEITPVPQDDAKATYSKILKKDDGRINWSRPAQELECMVRAFNPWPGTWTLWPSRKTILRIKIEEAEATEEETPLGTPGFVWQNDAQKLFVKTGLGGLEIKKLTLGGKKPAETKTFLHGYPDIVGEVLI